MLTMGIDEIERRARALADALGGVRGVHARIIDGASTIGGGSAPGSTLPTKLVAISVDGRSASALETRLRGGDPPVIARIVDDLVVLDLRTVAESEESSIVTALRRV